jgi:threonine synthase
VAVDGNYDDVNKLASEIAGEEEGWAFVNVNVRPFYAEGSKTLGYEIAEQLGWRLPDQIVIPVASGSQLTKVDKAFQELITLGLVEDKPYKIFGAQATGCSPVSDRLQGRSPTRSGRSSPTRLPSRWPSATRPTASTCSTSAGVRAGPSRTSPTTRSATAILLLARAYGRHLHRDGGRHHASAVLKKLVETGQARPRIAETVVINTGMGLKTLDAVADRVGPAATIAPTYAAFAATDLGS